MPVTTILSVFNRPEVRGTPGKNWTYGTPSNRPPPAEDPPSPSFARLLHSDRINGSGTVWSDFVM